ncbi:DNA-binding NarL/FixJ family response regulator [Pedobacter sp. AK017]|uniref:helix-turn-helix transcriptional regulator n=1 Tax=Pedobacter sp. AK017 TaxID=2723073 RepID=UPI00161F82A6|nr:LuxR C-terminal-related transcriptional regulator [Pedobacter sp. AK017]MBB5440091.1 DNA-binding NarL/FixJ family response regulator [Pedobacter sp. AK017]
MNTIDAEMHIAAFFIVLFLTNVFFVIILTMLMRKMLLRKRLQFNWYKQVFFERNRPGIFKENCLHYRLTKTEITIIELLYLGLSNKMIGDRTCISESTVKKHIQNIFFKTNTNNRASLIYLMQQGSETDK